MVGPFERLRSIALFDGLEDDDLARVCTDVRESHLEPREVLFREGDPGDSAYVITSGELEILKASARRDVLLAVRSDGDVIGEMALLQAEPRNATARARTAVDLVVIPKAALDDLLDVSPRASRAIFQTFLKRMRATNDQLRQSERLTQLGTLTAGVAHELNNPAAAVSRSARHLSDGLRRMTDVAARPISSAAREIIEELAGRPDAHGPSDSLARSDAEADLEERLDEAGIDQAWELAADLVDAGVTPDDLARMAAAVEDGDPADAVRLLSATVGVARIARQIADGAERISVIVRALKSYSYLDQSPVQDVDVRRGLDDTLALLASKTRGIEIVREYDTDLPTITALGTELNQVWTNLIDNACDALVSSGVENPRLTLRAKAADDAVVVDVEDNGPGIPPDVQGRVFDAFFTTKPPGEGTGLGLQISHRIVVLEHRGSVDLTSGPGRTTFRVTLPLTRDEEHDRDEDDQGDPGMNRERCDHLGALQHPTRPEFEAGCPSCLAAGDTWVHLRYCDGCGTVGCCDDSPNRHARAHAGASDHPVIHSLEPGEDWIWCYADEQGFQPS